MAIKSLGSGVTVVHSASLRVTTPPVQRARARAAAKPTEADAILAALRADRIALVKRVEIAPKRVAERGRSALRAAGGGDVEINVQVAANEDAVLLIEQNGEYHWELPDGTAIGAQRSARSATRAKGKPRKRTLTFTVRARVSAAPVKGLRSGGKERGLFGKVVAFVLKVARNVVGKFVIGHLEKDVKPGLLRIASTEPEEWKRLGDRDGLPMPKDRAANVLLLVHGTFSSTVGSFSGLRYTPEGLEFLNAAMRHYDLVLGYDHRTLSETPEENAKQLQARLNQLDWKQPPVVDAIAFSRGGLVLRTLTEQLKAGGQFKPTWNKVAFVGCTNGGTLLAEPENWGKLVDVYTNLAAAASRGLSFVPQARAFATILQVTVKGIGILVKYLASFVVDGGGVPGLAAMEPDGDVVRKLNSKSVPAPAGATYHAITNDYEPGKDPDGTGSNLPASWRMKLADGFVDRLMGEANDLVVNTAAMTKIGSGAFAGKVFPLGVNGETIHTTYFRSTRAVTKLDQWLIPTAVSGLRGRRSARGAGRRRRARAGK